MGSVCFKIQEDHKNNKNTESKNQKQKISTVPACKSHKVVSVSMKVKNIRDCRNDVAENNPQNVATNGTKPKSLPKLDVKDEHNHSTTQDLDDSWMDGQAIGSSGQIQEKDMKMMIKVEVSSLQEYTQQKPLTRATGSTLEEEFSIASEEQDSHKAEKSVNRDLGLATSEGLESPTCQPESLSNITASQIQPKSVTQVSKRKVTEARSTLLRLAMGTDNNRKVWSCDMKDLKPPTKPAKRN